MRVSGVCLALLWAATVACSAPRVNLGTEPHSFHPADYQRVFETWSRELRILPVDGIENVLTARATYLSHEFRWAYVVRVAHDLSMSPVERQTLQDREFLALQETHEFFITAMSGVKDSDDLSTEEGPWRIRLEDDRGRRISPLEIEEVEKPSAADVKYFAYDEVQRTAYRVRFPILANDGMPLLSEQTRFFTLLFFSPYGQGSLRWEVVGAAAPSRS